MVSLASAVGEVVDADWKGSEQRFWGATGDVFFLDLGAAYTEAFSL